MAQELLVIKKRQMIEMEAMARTMKENRKLFGIVIHSGRVPKTSTTGIVGHKCVLHCQTTTRATPQSHNLGSLHSQLSRPISLALLQSAAARRV